MSYEGVEGKQKDLRYICSETIMKAQLCLIYRLKNKASKNAESVKYYMGKLKEVPLNLCLYPSFD